MDRNLFDIPHHANLFAVIYKAAVTLRGEKGALAADEGTKLFPMNRVLGDLFRRDNSGRLNGNYAIGVTFGENYMISITPNIKINGNWGFSRRTRSING